jgi:predicted Zn-dependent protease with MMP-like domain
VSENWNWLLETARQEVEQTVANLPPDLQRHAETIPVTYESWPSEELIADGWEEDLLGMFVGDPLGIAEASGAPRQILLFLENLWDFAEGDPGIYREEVHITYIHEFGHFLGLDEDELAERGLL